MEGGCEYIGINTMLSGSLSPRHDASAEGGDGLYVLWVAMAES